ncbi:M48 family metalloprotease [Marinicella gelatinilytica]|uniref:M48 family metalloprotease n=1 Tax=Marinicella gelatinilytica TaxID=2996017 RepID=UPI002260F9CA|nr:M48 family metalloprotease [Marinicella gelatinilytica]MCX7545531.1 M48 family metalloprotease [Marinicella gelatinilytica]
MKFVLIIYLFVSLWQPVAYAQIKLPDLGNPSDAVMSEDDEARYRKEIRQQMYAYQMVMTDAVVASYIYHLGYRLAAHSDKPTQAYDFFVVPADVINASAYPGGLIVVYSGLILETANESELAGVLAHEIAHVSQRHISRMIAKQQKATIPILLGMLAAAAAASSSSSGDAPIAIASTMSGLQQQLAINFTRYHEYEADRVGINTLYKADLNPEGMAGFFAKLMTKNRVDPRYQLPEYLRTHPLSVNRVTEAKNRSKNFAPKVYKESSMYDFVKERLRVLTANEFDGLEAYYNNQSESKVNSAAFLYGRALHQYQHNKFAASLNTIEKINTDAETMVVVKLLKAQNLSRMDGKQGQTFIKQLLTQYPENNLVLEETAQIMMQSDDLEVIDQAIRNIRKLSYQYPENPHYQDMLAIAYYKAMKPIDAAQAMARRAHLLGQNYQAVRILKNLRKNENLDFYQTAKIDAQVVEYEPLITDDEHNRERDRNRPGR